MTIESYTLPESGNHPTNEIPKDQDALVLPDFQGKPLWPCTRATRLLYAMVESPNDILFYRALAFVYLHLKRGGKTMKEDMTKHAIPMAWGEINSFRAEIMEFRSSLSDVDAIEAYKIASLALDLPALPEVQASGKPKNKGRK